MMKLKQTIGGVFARAARSMLGPNVWKEIGSIATTSGIGANLDVPGLDKPASNFVWVYNCVVARSEAVMQAPLRISDRNDNIIEGGALYNLLARPNRWMDGVAFVGAIEAMMTVRNSAFVAPVSETGGALPDEIMLLAPQNVSPIIGVHKPTGVRVPMGWKHRDPYTVEERTFDLDELIPIQTFNPDNPFLGALNPQNALMRSLKMDMATREQNLAIFQNGGLPDFALVTDHNWNEDQAKEFLKRFLDNYQGYAKAHKPALLYNGVKIDKVGLNPEELQALEVLKTLTPQEIVAGLRTKPVMAGLMVGETGLSQGTSTEEQKIAWWSETGNAELARIAAALQQFLVDPFNWGRSAIQVKSRRAMTARERREFQRQRERMRAYRTSGTPQADSTFFVWFDTSNVPELAEHRWKRIESYDRLAGRGYLPDDLNDYFDLGLPPHPTNIGTLPFSLQSVTDLAGGGEEPREKEPEPRSVRHGEDELTRLEELLGEYAREVPKKYTAVRKAFDAFLKPREKNAAKKWSRFYLEQRKRVADRLAGLADRDDPPLSESGYGQEQMLEKVFPRDDEDGALVARLAPLWAEHMTDGWEFFEEHENPAEEANPFAIDDPRTIQALEKRKIQGLKVNGTTEDDLREIFKAAFEEGDTLAQLAGRIETYYKDHCVGEAKHRPVTAAQTQTAGIVNDGRLLAARQAGGLNKGWLHGGSSEPRPEHLAAQSKYLASPIGLDEKFEINGHLCDAPGDAELPVGETANCTCMVVFSAAKETA